MASTSENRSPPSAPGRGRRGHAQPGDEWRWFHLCLFAFTAVLILVACLGNPIRPPPERGKNARPFLKRLFPDRPVVPADSSTAPVAVVFHLIRCGDDDEARQAIELAAGDRLVYASPYVIEHLESPNAELRNAARAFLIAVAGEDHGPSARAWRAWWRDLPRTWLGFKSVGQTTFLLAMPVLVVLAGLGLWGVHRLRGGPPLSREFAGVFVWVWFTTFFVLVFLLVGGRATCTFGEETIAYHDSHGVVLGLQDARAGGSELFLLLLAAFLLLPYLLLGPVSDRCSRQVNQSQVTDEAVGDENHPR